VSVLFLHQNTDQDNSNFGMRGQTHHVVNTFANTRYDLLNGVLTYDFGPVLLTESIGYLDQHLEEQFDLTPFYLPVLGAVLGLPPGFITRIPYPDFIDTRTLNNELRLSSQGQGPFHWTVGGFFQRINVENNSDAHPAPGALPFSLLQLGITSRSSAYS